MILPSKEFWKIFKNTEGALSCTEAIAIMNVSSQAPVGQYIELGTYRGKSAMSALIGLTKEVVFSKEPINPVFTLVDPIFTDSEIVSEVLKRLSKIKTNISLRFNSLTSIECLQEVDTGSKYNYSYVFVDSGSHQDGLPMQEVKLLEDRVVTRGIISFHDFANQFREPKEAAEYLVSTGKYEWVEIDWPPIIDYVKENNLEDGNNSWHIYEDRPFPNFVGAVRRK